MAESTGEKGEKGFVKILGKRMQRTKEKVMQKIGNADRTTDNEFDRVVESFNEQQVVGNRLLKEFKNYMTHVKAMSVASQAMYQAIRDSYETSWINAHKFVPATEHLVSVWDDYLAKLNDPVLPLLADYVGKFRDVKVKVAKRGRKLTDFDSSRHNVDSLENAKKRDEGKISKAHDELHASRSVYESIHSELCEELPALYCSRIPSLCSYFGALFQAEAVFETECSKIKTSLAQLVEMETGAETTVRNLVSAQSSVSPPRPPSMNRNFSHPDKQKAGSDDEQHEYITLIAGSERIDSENSDEEHHRMDRISSVRVDPVDAGVSANRNSHHSSSDDGKVVFVGKVTQMSKVELSASSSSVESVPKNLQHSETNLASPLISSEGSLNAKEKKINEERKNSADGGGGERENGSHSSGEAQRKPSENVADHKSSDSSSDEESAAAPASTSPKEHNFLFQVVAVHTYRAEDADELSFEKGEIIGVLPLDDAVEEQDEGWLYGVKSSNGEKGVFPLNFTSRL